MTHDLPTTTIKGKEYVLINTNSNRSACTGCAFDKDDQGCSTIVSSASIHCRERLIYIPNTPEDIANHIAQRLDRS